MIFHYAVPRLQGRFVVLPLFGLAVALGCSSESPRNDGGVGGSPAGLGGMETTGGNASSGGNTSNGGSASGGTPNGEIGGSSSGGNDTGGAPSGGAGSGGEAAGGSGGLTMNLSDGCGTAASLTSGTRTIRSNNKDREFILRIPDNYDFNRGYRLIFGFHWRGGTMQDVDTGQTVTRDVWSYYGLQQLDTEKTAVFVAPQGLGNGWGNAGGEDITFVDAMIELIENDLCIDKGQIFSMGFSFGGGMTHALACARPEVFRAVAVYNGAVLSGCEGGTEPVALLQSHGVRDGVLNISAGRAMRDRFVQNNGCTPQNAPEPQPGSQTHITTDYEGCDPKYPVRWIAFDGDHDASPCDGACINAPANTKGRETYLPRMTWEFFTQFD